MKTKKIILLSVVSVSSILVLLGLLNVFIYDNDSQTRFKYDLYTISSCCTSRENEYASQSKLKLSQDDLAKKKVTVKFNGKEYSGEYKKSDYSRNDFYYNRKYECTDDSGCSGFWVNSETGQLTYISFSIDAPDVLEIDEELCRKAADDVLADFVDISGYEVTSSKQQGLEKDAVGYKYCIFKYNRKIGDYDTSEKITIMVNSLGEVVHFESESLGAFENLEAVEIDEEKALDTIERKLQGFYENSTWVWKGYKVNSATLVKINNREYGILYDVDNSFEPTEAGYYPHEGITFLLT